MDLKNKVVLITGSSTGIGRETAILCSKKGATVILTYHKTKKEGESALKECKANGSAQLHHLDLGDDASIASLGQAIKKNHGRLDVLINNSGRFVYKPIQDHTVEEIKDQISTNLTGLILMTQKCLALLLAQKEAVIINIASVIGKEGIAQATAYCATKFGVRGFTQALAQELPKNVRVYAVNPGLTATKMTDFEGVAPIKVAEIVVRAAEESLKKRSGDDIDVETFIK